ncbi:hypothetical protein OAT93_01010 [bacterium]|nr:hypothetical protein [bacterium]
MKFGIEKFIGLWESEDGYRIDIAKASDTSGLVSFYDSSGNAVIRPYYNDSPTIEMPASYDDYHGEFIIELWEKGKGFALDMHHEENYDLDKFKRESLIPAITRHEEDNFLDKYYELFGKLKHFTKIYKVRRPD